MRLARRALFAALTMLVLCAAVSAQTLRPEGDPRNTSPTVGTGGPAGGPTGLFTIYDGQTLRRGEFTFSIAYSNFDRDPGDVDITEVPVSFQIGLNDHMELFFNTDAYRGMKVNSPQNLSAFYLPNSQLYFGAGLASLASPAAIILAPRGPLPGGTVGLTAIYRPQGTQPFAQFPYSGSSSGAFGMLGLTAAQIGAFFGFPGLPTMGPPIASSGGGNFGTADIFPGIGSAYGGILPGVVFSNAIRTCTTVAGGPAGPCRVPASFTVAPIYLPDAPFINRLYGQTAFSTFTIGAKIRLTEPNGAFGFGFIPMYRFYADKADDAGGFNQLQRGASPGGSIGDFGLTMFADGRLSRSVNVSGNIGLWLNSNPKGTFPNGTFTLLDRPHELLSGVGFDFPVNKYFQPIIEVRSTFYVGGHTPNVFENNPLDVIAGFKAYPHRNMGFGVAWRYHVNQQDRQSFNNNGDRNNTLAATVNAGAVSFPVISGGVPSGFRPSDNANGFIFQVWWGRRNKREPEVRPNNPPVVSVSIDKTRVVHPCPTGRGAGDCPVGETVAVTTTASDPDGDSLLYSYTATGGTITGSGPNATWDLSRAAPGTYTATVEVNDGCGCITWTSTNTVVVENCPCPPCPTVSVSCPTNDVPQGEPATVSAQVSGGAQLRWSVSAGRYTDNHDGTITIDTNGLSGPVTASAEIVGAPPECPAVSSCTFNVRVEEKPVPRKFDEYGKLKPNDEKARLDNYVVELNRDPNVKGVVITYRGPGGPANEAQRRADFVRHYMVDVRGFDANRLTFIVTDGVRADGAWTELWIVPAGADNPAAGPTDPAPATPDRPRRRRH